MWCSISRFGRRVWTAVGDASLYVAVLAGTAAAVLFGQESAHAVNALNDVVDVGALSDSMVTGLGTAIGTVAGKAMWLFIAMMAIGILIYLVKRFTRSRG